jgi:hypothetical protein
VTGTRDTGRLCSIDIGITNYATIGLDLRNGATLWSATYTGLRRGPDAATGVVTNGSFAFVTGNSDQACSSIPPDVATVAYRA